MFFQCVFALMNRTEPLLAANRAARDVFGRHDDPDFMPHLSIVYGDLAEEAKSAAIRELRPQLVGQKFMVCGALAQLVARAHAGGAGGHGGAVGHDGRGAVVEEGGGFPDVGRGVRLLHSTLMYHAFTHWLAHLSPTCTRSRGL